MVRPAAQTIVRAAGRAFSRDVLQMVARLTLRARRAIQPKGRYQSFRVRRTEVLQVCRSGRISWAHMVLAPSVASLFKWRQAGGRPLPECTTCSSMLTLGVRPTPPLTNTTGLLPSR
jgi:hypothetical protein